MKYEKLIGEFNNNNLKIDGFVLSKQNNVLIKHYYKPFSENSLHRGFSITKTLTMLGIGVLVTDGLINVNDKVIKYFPEFDTKNNEVNSMEIKDLLTMRTIYKSTTYKRSNYDYLKSFFFTKPEKEAGNKFSYDTSASYTLAALVERVSGMKLIDLLKERVFINHPLSEHSYIDISYENISLGGSGMFVTLNDLYNIGLTLKNKAYGLIDEDFMNKALSKQADTSSFNGGNDFKQGYGYQTWINIHGGFTCYGMYGQLIYYIPQDDILFVCFSNLENERPETQKIIDILNSIV